MENFKVQIMMGLLNLLSFLYDVISFPIYFVIQKPWINRANSKKVKAKPISCNDYAITYRSSETPQELHIKLLRNNIDTLEKMFKFASKLNTTKRCIGTREVLGEEGEVQKDGRVFKKYKLGEYKWLNFTETETKSKYFGRGMREVGTKPQDRVAIFSETRAEWMIAAHGLFKQSCTIVTIYATLGSDAIAHGIQETEVDTVITSHELLPKIRNILKSIPKVKRIIYFEDKLHKTNTSDFGDIDVIPFTNVVKIGSESSIADTPPKESDIAIIMYTSGSTGVPKGVLLSHGNVITTLKAAADDFKVHEDDVYIGFLPLAHVFELVAESVALLVGVPIGYSSALTLLDNSPKIMKGYKGDVTILQPSIMTSVPLILDRIMKGIDDKVNNGSCFLQAMFNFAYNYKVRWSRRGFNTPFLNFFVFKNVAKLLGGNVRMLVCGGAPLSAETHEKVKMCLCLNLIQGYGLTETTCGATVMDKFDLTFGHVGTPLTATDVRLENWEEGHYRVTNKPYPQGEVIVGGENVAVGYFKQPEKTAEDFFNEDGKRWFRTGDIGEFHPNGILKIIDRKKDLVKLQQGEYISLGKVEAELKTASLVDNICVYGDPMKLSCVALVVPAERALKDLAREFKIRGEFDELCSDKDLQKVVLKELTNHAKKCGLDKFEIPSAITLCKDVWTPDSGLVTAAFKIKRKDIQDRYKMEIQKMYGN